MILSADANELLKSYSIGGAQRWEKAGHKIIAVRSLSGAV
jgi:hypothetical protein